MLLDLYSGTGTIALCLARKCSKVFGVESNQHAVDDAMENARHNRVTNATFLQADLSKPSDVAHVAERVPQPDVVVAGDSLLHTTHFACVGALSCAHACACNPEHFFDATCHCVCLIKQQGQMVMLLEVLSKIAVTMSLCEQVEMS